MNSLTSKLASNLLTQVRHYIPVYPVFEAKFRRFRHGKPVNTGVLLREPVCRAIIIV